MSRRAATLLLCVGLLGLSYQSAAASKLVALVVGNESPDSGLSGTELNLKLKSLKDSLFKYGDESTIFEGTNLSREELLTRMRAFEAGLPGAEVAIFYYVGLGAHNKTDGNSYLVPRGWDGNQESDLVSIRNLLERMRANGKGLVFLDAVQPKTSPGWQVANVQPGLGSFSREADAERLQIAFVDVIAGPTGSGGLLTGAMVRRLQPERIKVPQLASLVQQDVSIDTGGAYVPRLFGSMSGSLELQRLSAAELQTKTEKCVDQREQAAETTAPAADRASVEASLGEPMRLAGPNDMIASRSQRFWGWFCPEFTPRERIERSPRQVARPPTSQKQAVQKQPARVGSAARAPSPSYSRGGGGGGGSGGGGGGGGHARAAASGVPMP